MDVDADEADEPVGQGASSSSTTREVVPPTGFYGLVVDIVSLTRGGFPIWFREGLPIGECFGKLLSFTRCTLNGPRRSCAYYRELRLSATSLGASPTY